MKRQLSLRLRDISFVTGMMDYHCWAYDEGVIKFTASMTGLGSESISFIFILLMHGKLHFNRILPESIDFDILYRFMLFIYITDNHLSIT